MPRYKPSTIDHLREEAMNRFDRLRVALSVPPTFYAGEVTVAIDSSEVRMAVQDCETILSEIQRLA
jgi:hypothetical protein